MSLEHIVGTATVMSSLAGRFIGYPAQIRLIVKTRMVSNLSVSLHTIGFISCLLWTWHGWLNRDWVILLTQGLAGIAATGSMLFLIWRYRPRVVAGESLMAVLVHIASLDGEMDPRERDEVERIAAQWQLTADFSLAALSMTVQERQREAQAQLQRYLSLRPPVQQMRELKDVIWLLVQADGIVTDDERALVKRLHESLDAALSPYEQQAAVNYRVVVMPRELKGVELINGFNLCRLGSGEIWATEDSHTEIVARQYAAELRGRGYAALAVRDGELVNGTF